MRRAMIHLSGLLFAMALSACGLRPGASPEPVSKDIGFENTSDEAVRVYLIGAGQDWLLGRVGPGRAARLRVPAGFPRAAVGTVSLAVIPEGIPDLLGAGAARVPYAIRSGPYLMGDLLGMRWALRGQHLIAQPLGVRGN